MANVTEIGVKTTRTDSTGVITAAFAEDASQGNKNLFPVGVIDVPSTLPPAQNVRPLFVREIPKVRKVSNCYMVHFHCEITDPTGDDDHAQGGHDELSQLALAVEAVALAFEAALAAAGTDRRSWPEHRT